MPSTEELISISLSICTLQPVGLEVTRGDSFEVAIGRLEARSLGVAGKSQMDVMRTKAYNIDLEL